MLLIEDKLSGKEEFIFMVDFNRNKMVEDICPSIPAREERAQIIGQGPMSWALYTLMFKQ